MQLIDILKAAQGGQAVANVARSFGLSPAQAEAALAAIMPELSRGIERNTISRGGLADLVRALGDGRHQVFLEDARALGHPAVRAEGNQILEHILGDKDKSRGAAARAARASGVEIETIKQMLPFAAAMTMGALSKQTAGGFGDILSKLPEILAEAQRRGGGTMQIPMPGGGGMGGGRMGEGMELPRGGIELPGGGGFPLPLPQEEPQGQQGQWGRQGQWPEPPQPYPQQMPQQFPGGFGDAQPGSGGGGGFGNQAPLPVPGGAPGGGWGGGDGGYGRQQSPFPFPMPQPQQGPQGRNPLDDLSDILRKGGGAGGMGGGMLWNIVRSILGGALGFNGGGGVMSWIFRMVILRYGWSILKAILGRAVLGR